MRIEKYLAEVKERADKTTGSIWAAMDGKRLSNNDTRICSISGQPWHEILRLIAIIPGENDWTGEKENSDFIAKSRQDVPRLVRIIERLRFLFKEVDNESFMGCIKCFEISSTAKRALEYDGSEEG